VGGARRLRLSSEADEALRLAQAGDPAALRLFEGGDGVQLDVEVLAVKRVAAGAGVSYGHTHVTERDTTLALVAIGYGHGLPRKAGNRASTTWTPTGGVPVHMPIVGRVAMDVCVVDAADAGIAVGDRVVIFGRPDAGAQSLADWAESVGEDPLSVIAALDARVTREVVR
jgi:alanine racemase